MKFNSAKCVCGAVYQAPQTDILEMIGDSALAQSFSGGEIEDGQLEDWGTI